MLAKVLGYVGGSALALGQSNVFGKYSGLLSAVGSIVMALGVHSASNSGPASTK